MSNVTKRISQLEQRARQRCADHATLGLSIAVVEDGQMGYAHGFGTREGRVVTAETPFEAGSLTKPVFAYAVLKLVEQGVLGLDTPLQTYLPYPYLTDEPFLPRITARHALSHTTGFPNWRPAEGLRAAFEPGSRYSYSGEGYFYLQTVVEHLTGQPLHVYLAQQVFEPLGMNASEMMVEDWSDYRPYASRGIRSYAAASLKTTAPDYARFLIAMLAQDQGDAHRLSAATIDHMLTPQIPVGDQPGLWWGIGWGLQKSPLSTTLGAQPSALSPQPSALGPRPSALSTQHSFWQWGGWRDVTRNFAIGDRAECTGVVVFTNSLLGLPMCEELISIVQGQTGGYPAFRWLWPVEQWRADGSRPIPGMSRV